MACPNPRLGGVSAQPDIPRNTHLIRRHSQPLVAHRCSRADRNGRPRDSRHSPARDYHARAMRLIGLMSLSAGQGHCDSAHAVQKAPVGRPAGSYNHPRPGTPDQGHAGRARTFRAHHRVARSRPRYRRPSAAIGALACGRGARHGWRRHWAYHAHHTSHTRRRHHHRGCDAVHLSGGALDHGHLAHSVGRGRWGVGAGARRVERSHLRHALGDSHRPRHCARPRRPTRPTAAEAGGPATPASDVAHFGRAPTDQAR